MHPRPDTPTGVQLLLREQAGAVTREQALALGMSAGTVRRLVAQGRWQRVGSGVFVLEGLSGSWLTMAWAGVLIGGDLAAVAGAAAAHLQGLDVEPPQIITVLMPATTRVPRVQIDRWRFVRTRRPLRSVGSPPRTPVEDTVLDLCADPDLPLRQVVGLVTDAVQQRRTTAPRLTSALRARSRHPRRRQLRELLGDVRAGVRSPLERHYLRDVERAHGLPVGDRQDPRDRTEVDVWYRPQRLLVELDGRLGHAGSRRFRDMSRDNGAAERDLQTLRYGYHDVVTEPCDVAAQVAAVLQL